ncbi:hypothetical protein ACFFIX_23555 [Metabacillus herbersteinensis]|uniref:Uncharacterized protein n=1 Tax=Metabacillus herbersteinensis TaxID=283816 RepID=A0ABV6GKV7_9BACI
MITIAYIVVFCLMSILLAVFDMFLYRESIFDSIYHLFQLDFGTRKWMVYISTIIGLISAILTDINHRKTKKVNKDRSR